MRKGLLLIGLMMSTTSVAVAGNWTHWRGPTGNGVAVDATPPTRWSLDENIKWKVAIPGRGSSSPIVWQNQVFVTTAVPREGGGANGLPTMDFKLLCFDRGTGKMVWEQTAVTAAPHEETHSTNSFASASPCTDGVHVYAHFGSRGIYCYTLSGELVWKRDDFPPMRTRNSFGEGSSPTLAGDKVLLPWDHEGPSALYALDKRTGKTLWKTERDEPTCWATPFVMTDVKPAQVVMNGQNFARSYDLETGKELWRCDGQTERPAASAAGANGVVYVGSGHRGAFMGAFFLNGRGDIEGTDQVKWTLKQDTPDVASPVLSGNRLYFFKARAGQISCVNAETGRPYYQASRIAALDSIYASPVIAGGYVFLSARNGNTVVIEDGEELKIVATNSLGETIDATPAPVDNELFIRGENHLFCIAE
jgi:outer membrane protein assembly factor BamB